MLYQIPSFLLDVIVGLLGGACLLRLYMQYHRVPFGNPLGRFIFAITDWIVLPLRRIVPPVKRWDLASLIAAWLLVLMKFLLLWLLIGNLGRIATLPLVSLVGLMQLAVSGLTALLVVYAVLSWIPGASPMLLDLISRLAEPLVRPFRRFIPLIGGTVDGYIDYHRDEVRMRGTFVPLYGLNNMFGQLPIVGPFLGGSNEGLLGVTYEVVGPPSTPVLRVNPISAVAPGLLRKFFEFPGGNVPLPAQSYAEPGRY